MILIDQRFLSADHIEYIYIQQFSDGLCTVTVQMSSSSAVFGRSRNMDEEMAVELRNRIIQAIVRYKSSKDPEIQRVEFPTYQEVHPEGEAKKS